MGLRGRIRKLEREAEEEMIVIPQTDGTVKRFPQSALKVVLLYPHEVMDALNAGEEPPEEPEIVQAIRGARDYEQEWAGTFLDPTDIPTEAVPDLSEL